MVAKLKLKGLILSSSRSWGRTRIVTVSLFRPIIREDWWDPLAAAPTIWKIWFGTFGQPQWVGARLDFNLAPGFLTI